MSNETSTLLLCARVLPGSESPFAQWQVRWQTSVLASKGAVSVEFWPPAPPDQLEAVAIARFTSVDTLRVWRRGAQNRKLVDEVALCGPRERIKDQLAMWREAGVKTLICGASSLDAVRAYLHTIQE